MSEKLEFSGAAWMAELRRTLEARVAEAANAGPLAPFSFCEIYTNVPAHLKPANDGTISWHLRITDNSLEFAASPLPDADVVIAVDYQTTLPRARTVYGDDPEALAERDRQQRLDSRAGKFDMKSNGAMPGPYMDGLHDYMAVRTA